MSKAITALPRTAIEFQDRFSSEADCLEAIAKKEAMGKRDESIILAGLIELDEVEVGAEARKTGRRRLGSL